MFVIHFLSAKVYIYHRWTVVLYIICPLKNAISRILTLVFCSKDAENLKIWLSFFNIVLYLSKLFYCEYFFSLSSKRYIIVKKKSTSIKIKSYSHNKKLGMNFNAFQLRDLTIGIILYSRNTFLDFVQFYVCSFFKGKVYFCQE